TRAQQAEMGARAGALFTQRFTVDAMASSLLEVVARGAPAPATRVASAPR
ncbi:MAG: hypothetical protein H7Y61_00690, partial [Rhizobiales bacterium]|nr:hypothetical protein [Rhizobacter sp.]